MTSYATLTVNLSAIRANYRLLSSRHAKNNIGAVVKANAYGLGVAPVSKALWEEGAREFFVATMEEGAELRAALPEAKIYIFQGIFAGEKKEFLQHKLIPVLNSLEQVELYNGKGEFAIHIDTGMTRLGLSETNLKKLPTLHTPNSTLIISHLSCANTPEHPKNAEQLSRFKNALKYFPNARASLANSAGVFLPSDFHFDMARTGCAMYGINPRDDKREMQPVAKLSAPILQIRELDRDEQVGYGATYSAKQGGRIAIAGIGYADGYFRCLSNQSFAYIAGHKVPLIGRVSMDMVALDVSEIPETVLTNQNLRAEFINDLQTVDDIATQANTIGYEVFTRIGRRVKREYI